MGEELLRQFISAGLVGHQPSQSLLTSWQTLSRSICWNWHNIPHKVGSREVQEASTVRWKTRQDKACS